MSTPQRSLRILVLGGTRLLGPPLVRRLAARGHLVTVSSRRPLSGPRTAQVREQPGDRSDPAHLAALFAGGGFDVVIDNTAYHGDVVRATIEPWAGRIGRYLLTSTAWAYLARPDQAGPFVEEDLDPAASAAAVHPSRSGVPEVTVRYVAGKRTAEQAACALPCSVQICRPCMFSGAADHNRRIAWFADELWAGRSALATDVPPFQLAWVEDVAEAMVRLAERVEVGPACWNIAPAEQVCLTDLLRWVAQGVGPLVPPAAGAAALAPAHPFVFSGGLCASDAKLRAAFPTYAWTSAATWIQQVAGEFARQRIDPSRAVIA